jgi:hypothetical protein
VFNRHTRTSMVIFAFVVAMLLAVTFFGLNVRAQSQPQGFNQSRAVRR